MQVLLLDEESLQLFDPHLHLLDCPLAAGNGRSLDLLHADGQAADLGLEGLAGGLRLDDLGLFLAQKSLTVLGIMGGLVGAVIGEFELASDVGVVGADGGQLFLNLGHLLGEGDVDVGYLSQAGSQLDNLRLGNLLGVESLVKGGAVLVGLLLQDLELVSGSIVLVKSALELLVGGIKSAGQLHDPCCLELR